MYPLPALVPLATDIKHMYGQPANVEARLGDAGALQSRAEDVLLGGEVGRVGEALDGRNEAAFGVKFF
jgi:hypothetical protein